MSMLTTYFTLVTLITAAMLVLGLWQEPQAVFGYEAYAAPLLYGLCGMLPMGSMYSRRELTIKEVVIRKGIQLLLIEVLVLCAAFGGTEITEERMHAMGIIGISIFVIFMLAHVIGWLQDCATAKQMTKELMNLQHNGR